MVLVYFIASIYTSCHWNEPVRAIRPVRLVAEGARMVIFLFSISIAVLCIVLQQSRAEYRRVHAYMTMNPITSASTISSSAEGTSVKERTASIELMIPEPGREGSILAGLSSPSIRDAPMGRADVGANESRKRS